MFEVTGEMDQWIKTLAINAKGPEFRFPTTLYQLGIASCAWDARTGRVEVGSLRTHWPASLAKIVSSGFIKSPYLKNNKVENDWERCSSGLCMWTHRQVLAHKHMYKSHTQAHTMFEIIFPYPLQTFPFQLPWCSQFWGADSPPHLGVIHCFVLKVDCPGLVKLLPEKKRGGHFWGLLVLAPFMW